MHQQSAIEVHIPAKSIDFEREKNQNTLVQFDMHKEKILDNIG